MKLLLLVSSLVISAWGDKKVYYLPPFTGNGSCSEFPVRTLSYQVTSTSPLSAVLACNKQAYDALLSANLSDPATADLPPPLIEMSCVNQNNNVCAHTFPASRKLKPQIMCILVKNWRKMNVNATLEVDWVHANDTANDTDSNATAPVMIQPPVTSTTASTTLNMVAAVMTFVIAII